MSKRTYGSPSAMSSRPSFRQAECHPPILEEEQYRALPRCAQLREWSAMLGVYIFLAIFLAVFILPIFFPMDSGFRTRHRRTPSPPHPTCAITRSSQATSPPSTAARSSCRCGQGWHALPVGHPDSEAAKLPSSEKFTQASAGLDHALALDAAGRVHTWEMTASPSPICRPSSHGSGPSRSWPATRSRWH